MARYLIPRQERDKYDLANADIEEDIAEMREQGIATPVIAAASTWKSIYHLAPFFAKTLVRVVIFFIPVKRIRVKVWGAEVEIEKPRP